MDLQPARIRRGQSALLHRHRREARKPDHVADGENIRHLRAIFGVHRNAPAIVRLQPGRRQVQLVDIALPADRVQQRVAGDHACCSRRCATTPPSGISSTLSTSSFSRMVTR